MEDHTAPTSPSTSVLVPRNRFQAPPTATEIVGLGNEKSLSAAESNPVQIVAESSTEDPSSMLGCEHYKRKCQLVCPDPKCDKVYTCRICHDEAELSHQLDRYSVKAVVCLKCNTRQPVSNCCFNCSTTFGNFFCRVCNLFMDIYKDTFHCDGCGLCRVGPKENFFHCDKCAMCMPVGMGSGKHKCIEKSSQRDCPVCLEDIHTSRNSSHVPPCGHLLHQYCFNQLIRKALYACPICNQSMIDMSVVWKHLDDQLAASPPLPPEFTNEVQILCRDCHESSTVMFHFVGLKCGSCGGYNTTIERGSALNPEAFAAHQQQLQEQMLETGAPLEGGADEEETDDEPEDVDDSSYEDSDADTAEYQSVEEFEDEPETVEPNEPAIIAQANSQVNPIDSEGNDVGQQDENGSSTSLQ